MIPDFNAQPYARLQELLHLPPLPATATQLLQEITHPEADIDTLAELIEQDPGLAARIVGIANSAYFARQREVGNVRDAIVRVLGLNIVRGLAIGIALSAPFSLDACPGFELDRYWYRAFQTARLASHFAAQLNLTDEERECLFLAGLLHNLGQLVLVNAFPGRMSDVFAEWKQDKEQPLVALEMKHLSVDEIGAGSLVTRNWNLPNCVGEVIRYRHEPYKGTDHRSLIEWISWCSELAADMYNKPNCTPRPLSQAGPAAARLQDDSFAEHLAEIMKTDEQTRALAAGLSQGTGA